MNTCHNKSDGKFCATGGGGGMPAAGDLTSLGSASHMGGTKPKQLYADKAGNKYMFKPLSPSDEFRGHAEAAVSQIAAKVLDDVVPVQMAKVGGKTGTLQKIVPNVDKGNPDFSGGALNHLKPTDVARLQGEHVVDWLTSQHDSHPKQFLRTTDGKIYGIDKSQAYKHLGNDRLSPNYHPNAAYGEVEPVYNTMGRMAQQGKLKMDPMNALPYIKKAQGIPDADFKAALQPYAESLFKSPGQRDQFYNKALARKANLKSDFEDYYSKILGKPFSFDQKVGKSDDGVELIGTISKVEPDKRLVFGWVTIAEEGGKTLVDKQGDVIAMDEVEKMAYNFVLNCRQAGEMHEKVGVGKLVESIVLTKEKQDALGIDLGRTGWWAGFKVSDDAVWDKVKKGDYKAFSIHGKGIRQKIDKVED